jgi:hypothetical protein
MTIKCLQKGGKVCERNFGIVMTLISLVCVVYLYLRFYDGNYFS